MIDLSQFKGTGVALITPFRADGSVDFSALEKLINFQVKSGTNYLVALGTTSEAATLSIDEKQAIVDFIIEVNNKRLPLVVGCGSNNTRELIDIVRKLEKPGVNGVLSVAPYYNKPNQEGLYQHFKSLANATALPIILYNVPGRTSVNINAETTIKLAKDQKNIVAIKEASGNFEQAMNLVKNKPNGFLVLSGDDATALPLIALGFDGVISVVANAFPSEFSKLVQLSLNGDFEQARVLHYRLIDIIHTLFEEGNPAGVKAYLHCKNMIEDSLRLPLVPVSANLMAKIKDKNSRF
ncbi:MAG TPA: 4-hydroxy-tetrahydrodipicolinate synthase [Marinilabiliales bacterium]|jgi:4-hydroxy-tetrahydrodipicolinate synthase|nr:MAG: 4-hydroxy-tetrahydrodipicolinate synthase [Bacteroidetes bacterium GWA2_40_14]OFX63405.1 MAG: 4-hydroxy-tetrahydrodipicolinate synthase [Bacteroidetes bacterium GWC2_40_13]OFX74651.1 MAG: 4-hydroxy-tetrahydrodipicolinate synthase [Bacteroidetes bacterium GWD2_40_43]OFX93727.1 MAG: 4-hydroxy-tetrahydrodipicolinate synthase [Bacteroidetes bacterium GWE2_40_63]OFY18528.1 MAG: 4-hydroxy-tetrahydrodipicolinate synthase [Bacteroidetes bacterium GWF2_40_13]OFZ32079.1 MAG: 4-hydroxy-tetrahydro